MATILLMAEEFIACLKKQNEKYQKLIKGMDRVAEETQRGLFFVSKPAKYLNRVAPLQSGVVQIQATYQMLAEVLMKKQKDITGNSLDLICV